MKRLSIVLLFLSISWFCSAAPLRPGDLVEGGYVLYFRHAQADDGVDCKDPEQAEWWKSEDSGKTRQLTDYGKLQARAIGQAFRRLKIPVGLILCSEFRRTQDTTQLMALGQPLLESKLTPLTSLGELEPRLRPLLTTSPKQGTNTVLVAHGHVLPEFEELEEGSAVVFQPGKSRPLGTISFEDWAEAAGGMSFESRNDEDRFTFEDSVLTIQSSTGIGEVDVRTLREEWPDLRKLRFEYLNGQGMQRLEGLRIRTDSTEYKRSQFARSVLNGAIEVTLPTELPQSVEFMKIHWVDVYR